ncbi:glycoside hydrolase family 9 protein [Carboxylicivirga linearis]|uniref:Glycoside hydrolase family 9 protein n=1 Tax=Carboxylicivirga linearis TaxID=1628157 RepID=A0ABS5JXZ6_9BACT|nr:glycoside hydrolase family 9 protein [Carboxylicivirga linearis]MBS2099680.1 glycoside hydrolase family 9 protein [Carboxylicivirga linearis]
MVLKNISNPYKFLLSLLFLISTSSFAQKLTLNEKEYFETKGLNVLVFNNQYNGFFFDEKTAGIELIHHGVRTSTGGAVRLQNTPEQWDLIPILIEKSVDKASKSIEFTLRYEDYDFDSKITVSPEGNGFQIVVSLDQPVPESLKGRAGFNLEFLPSAYFEKSYLVDGKPSYFPLYPSGNTTIQSSKSKIPQFGGHNTFDDRGLDEFIIPKPLAQGNTLVLAPEDPERYVKIESESEIMLFDGRNLAQNGWFIARSILPSNQTGEVLEWHVEPNTIENWVRKPNIGFSQVGYHPDQKKVAVIELDRNDVTLKEAFIYEVTVSGKKIKQLSVNTEEWGNYLRYNYLKVDFSSITKPGLYCIQYGDQTTNTFSIDPNTLKNVWHPTLDVFLPVQMDHMQVNEAYRTWHGEPFKDDALQAPVNIDFFDGYSMDSVTDTKYKPLERIPGLAVGGWFDAGDYDIQTGTHCRTIQSLVDSWEYFKIKRDQTYINQATRYVDIHRPDGDADILQQIEHGTLNLVAQIENIGHPVRGIIVPTLHQYHHLGDASTETDNLPYNPNLKPYESDGVSSGTLDDRWAFTNRNYSLDFSTVAAFSAASRALKDYNSELADKCLRLAKTLYTEAREIKITAKTDRYSRWGRFNEVLATFQLYISSGEKTYAKRYEELIWPALDESSERTLSMALRAIPHMGEEFKEKLKKYVVKHKTEIEELGAENPYGVPISTRGWAGNAGVIEWASTNFMAYKAYPEIIEKEDVYKGLNYLFGCHPDSNISFVSAVGTRSKKVAYGSNRADFSFIAGGIVPGVLILNPDFPENKEDWPFFWGENEYIIDIGAAYIYLANAVNELLIKE